MYTVGEANETSNGASGVLFKNVIEEKVCGKMCNGVR